MDSLWNFMTDVWLHTRGWIYIITILTWAFYAYKARSRWLDLGSRMTIHDQRSGALVIITPLTRKARRWTQGAVRLDHSEFIITIEAYKNER